MTKGRNTASHKKPFNTDKTFPLSYCSQTIKILRNTSSNASSRMRFFIQASAHVRNKRYWFDEIIPFRKLSMKNKSSKTPPFHKSISYVSEYISIGTIKHLIELNLGTIWRIIYHPKIHF